MTTFLLMSVTLGMMQMQPPRHNDRINLGVNSRVKKNICGAGQIVAVVIEMAAGDTTVGFRPFKLLCGW